MTDKEFWSVMAVTVGEACSMPDYYPIRAECLGLCGLVYSAAACGLVGRRQSKRLYDQIPLVRPERAYSGYYWPLGDWRPRVAAMRRLAELAQRENGTVLR